MDVTHDEANGRFVVAVEGEGGEEAVLRYVLQHGGTVMNMVSVYVPPAYRGRGLAERVTQAAFEHAEAKGLRVVPTCPYISGAYLRRHPRWVGLTG